MLFFLLILNILYRDTESIMAKGLCQERAFVAGNPYEKYITFSLSSS